jgi:poly-gamma-glutamate synthesis protein (capsule biosynthesis protein)
MKLSNHKANLIRQAGKIAAIALVIVVLLPLNLPVSGGYSRPELEPGLTMLAVGDLMLGRGVEKLASASTQGLDYPFSLTASLTHSADLTFGNLESPLVTPDASQAIDPSEGYLLQANPAYALSLQKAGFNLFTLANNHAFDYGPGGVLSSVNTLREAGLEYAGAGDNPAATLFFDKNGLTLALVAATQVDPRDPGRAGAYVGLFDSERVLNQIREARRRADLVIVALHWGSEYQAEPSKWQREWVARASAAGADLILGTHPHVVGPFEVLNNRTVVAYSLGNFISDNGYPPATTRSVGLYLKLDKRGVASAMAIPLKIEADRPRPLQPHEREEGLRLLNQTSDHGSAFQAQALYWNGTDWAISPGLFYRRDASPNGAISLPASRTLQVQDWSGEQGGYNAGRVIDDLSFSGAQTIDERIELKGGNLTVWRPDPNGWHLIFESPPEWRVQQFAFGDADEDGRPELVFSLWKNNGQDDKGLDRSHPFVYGWRRGAFRPVWAGSALADPIREFALADFKGDGHNELVVLEGSYADTNNAPANYATVWAWNGWGYELLFRSSQGHYSSLDYPPGQPYAFFKQTS